MNAPDQIELRPKIGNSSNFFAKRVILSKYVTYNRTNYRQRPNTNENAGRRLDGDVAMGVADRKLGETLDAHADRPSADTAAPGIHIYLFGGMRVERADGTSLLPAGCKARALLACLCLAHGKPVARGRLAGLLWDRSAEAQARASLRQSLSELTVALAEAAPALVIADRDMLAIDISACSIDAWLPLDPSGAVAVDFLDFRPERLLEDVEGISAAFDQWLTAERERFAGGMRQRLETELARLEDAGAAAASRAAAARSLVLFEPTHEGAARSLMKAFVEMGDRPQAIREYERLRQALRQFLDIGPSRETNATYEAIRRLPSPAPAAAAPVDAPTPAAGTLHARPRFLAEAAATASPFPRASGLIAQGRASIAVLPLRNLTGDLLLDYVGEGLAEDLIEALSRVPGLFVISRLSSLAFRAETHALRDVGDALGVRFLLSGSVRKSGERLRISVELSDTDLGSVLWVAKFDEPAADMFELQDRVSEAIVRRAAPHMHAVEIKRARSKRPENLQAYDLFLRALESMHNSARPVFDSALGMFDAAIRHDPGYATAHAWRAYWHVLRVGQGWSPDPGQDALEAEAAAALAIESDPMEPMAHAVHGHIAAYLHKDFDLAFERFDRALTTNPNSAPAWLWSAAAHAWMGHGPEAVGQIGKAMALTPYDPLMYAYSGIAGMAYLADRQYDRAVEFGLRCMQENGTYTHAYRLLAIALVLSGRPEDARAAARRLMDLEPSFTVQRFHARYPGSGSAHASLYCEALLSAGVPATTSLPSR